MLGQMFDMTLFESKHIVRSGYSVLAELFFTALFAKYSRTLLSIEINAN